MSPVSDGSFRKRETPPPGRPGAMSPVNDGSFRKLSSSPKLGATAGETAPSTSSPLGSRRDGAPTDFLYQLEAAEAPVGALALGPVAASSSAAGALLVASGLVEAPSGAAGALEAVSEAAGESPGAAGALLVASGLVAAPAGVLEVASGSVAARSSAAGALLAPVAVQPLRDIITLHKAA